MVDPSRIRHRIQRIEIDMKSSATRADLYFVDFYVNGQVRWYLSYSISKRHFTLYGREDSVRWSIPEGRLRDYLSSILPPDILAMLIAASLETTT